MFTLYDTFWVTFSVLAMKGTYHTVITILNINCDFYFVMLDIKWDICAMPLMS